MSGPPGSNGQDEGRGLNYRTLDDLFQLTEHRSGEVRYQIHVQMLEIYNESLRDLLVEAPDRSKLEVRSTERTGESRPGRFPDRKGRGPPPLPRSFSCSLCGVRWLTPLV